MDVGDGAVSDAFFGRTGQCDHQMYQQPPTQILKMTEQQLKLYEDCIKAKINPTTALRVEALILNGDLKGEIPSTFESFLETLSELDAWINELIKAEFNTFQGAIELKVCDLCDEPPSQPVTFILNRRKILHSVNVQTQGYRNQRDELVRSSLRASLCPVQHANAQDRQRAALDAAIVARSSSMFTAAPPPPPQPVVLFANKTVTPAAFLSPEEKRQRLMNVAVRVLADEAALEIVATHALLTKNKLIQETKFPPGVLKYDRFVRVDPFGKIVWNDGDTYHFMTTS
jgi:hypothetical protein